MHFFTFVISRLICFDFRVQSLLLLLLPSDDMGLTQKDTTSMVAELAKTMTAANAAILSHGGFSTRMMIGRKPTAIDSNETDPRPPATCSKFMRQCCKPDKPLQYCVQPAIVGAGSLSGHLRGPYPLGCYFCQLVCYCINCCNSSTATSV